MRYVDLSGLFCFFRILLPENQVKTKVVPWDPPEVSVGCLCLYVNIELRGTVSLSSLTRE